MFGWCCELFLLVYVWSAHDVMVIFIGNGDIDQSSNPGQGSLYFIYLEKDMNPMIIPPDMGK